MKKGIWIGSGLLFILGSLVFAVLMIIMAVRANYHYNQDYYSYWSLADKASTISQKSDYIDKFVAALGNAGLSGQNDALYFKTSDNSFDQNFQALQSLQSRLHEIKTMDESSFQYQTAIQQITAQEQGQADDMLGVFNGVWTKIHYPWLWNPWLILLDILLPILGVTIGVILMNLGSDDNF